MARRAKTVDIDITKGDSHQWHVLALIHPEGIEAVDLTNWKIDFMIKQSVVTSDDSSQTQDPDASAVYHISSTDAIAPTKGGINVKSWDEDGKQYPNGVAEIWMSHLETIKLQINPLVSYHYDVTISRPALGPDGSDEFYTVCIGQVNVHYHVNDSN